MRQNEYVLITVESSLKPNDLRCIQVCAMMFLLKPSSIGELGESSVLAALIKAGYRVSLPFGDHDRYDLVAELDGQFQRLQVKVGRLKQGGIVFRTVSSTGKGASKIVLNYLDNADSFAVYCPELDSTYLVPVHEVSASGVAVLRTEPCKNGQEKGVRWAQDYVVVVQSG